MNPQEAQTETTKAAQEYSVKACAPGDLSDAELATCVEIVKDGGAVAISLEKLQNARMLAVARKAGMIVGVGSIKRDRPDREAGSWEVSAAARAGRFTDRVRYLSRAKVMIQCTGVNSPQVPRPQVLPISSEFPCEFVSVVNSLQVRSVHAQTL